MQIPQSLKPQFMDQYIEVERVGCPGCECRESRPLTQACDWDYLTTAQIFQIVRCVRCGLIYVNPRPKLTDIAKIYPAEYSAYHFDHIRNPLIRRARAFMQQGKGKAITRYLGTIRSGARIVDVGCGSTTLLALIRAAYPYNLQLYGNDFSAQVIENIIAAGFQAMPGAFEAVQWPDNFFDVVVMNQVIEHLFDVPGCLNKALSVLKPGGILFIETPSQEGLDAVLFKHNYWGGYHVPRHLQIFSSATLRQTLERRGFAVKKISYLPSPNFWTSSMRNFLICRGLPYSLARMMNYRNLACMAGFSLLDLLTRPFHPTSNMRIVAVKPGV